MTTYLILITAAIVGTLVAGTLILLFKITGLKCYDPYTLWVRTLIYGNYSQTRSLLKDDCGFCCLGVGCDLHSRIFNIPWEFNTNEVDTYLRYTYLNDSCILPKRVMNWLGVTCEIVSYDEMGRNTGCTSAADLNDSYRWSFKEIGRFLHNNRIKLTDMQYIYQYGN